MSSGLSYRGYIQGLRGIAVICVVLYHVRSVLIPGGYVGVDVFFVISGFLLTRISINDFDIGNFSFSNFYFRRVRRILPALIVVSIVILIFSYLLLLPPELYNVAQSLISSSLFVPNIYFYETSNYFGPSASVLPALHFWSLGIEEQYYIVLPLILWATLTRSRAFLQATLATLFICSLLTSEILLYYNPTAAFYLLPSRAFELLIGSLIASLVNHSLKTEFVVNGIAGTGIALVALSVAIFDGETRFPGLAALLPTVGVGLIIWASESRLNIVALALSSRLLSYIGSISYSLYLVHWPTIIFSNAYLWLRLPAILLICWILAALSYFFIEKPFRNIRSSGDKRVVFVGSGGALLVVLSVCMVVLHYDGFSSRLGPLVSTILAYRSTVFRPYFRSGVCFLDPEQKGVDFDLSKCLPKTEGTSAILWGDSAAASLYSGLQQGLANQGYSLGQLTSSACAPALGLSVAARPNCLDVNNTAIKLIIARKPDLVILSANWPPRVDLLEGLDRSIDLLATQNIPVVILGSPLQYRTGVPQILADRLLSGNATTLSGKDLLVDYIVKQDSRIEKHFRYSKKVKFLSVLNTVCVKFECPMMVDFKVPVEFDSEHLTLQGSKLIGGRLVSNILALSRSVSSDD